jgi:hypothetical protein
MGRFGEALLIGVILLCLVGGYAFPYRHGHIAQVADRTLGISDFGAFYCGGLALRGGANPYLRAPLGACEADRVYAPAGETYEQHGGVDTAPLPPYVLALFAPFTFLPYRIAALLWVALLFACTVAAAAGLARLGRVPYWIALAVLAPGAAACFAFGQTQPIVTLALVCAALLVRSARPAWAVPVLAVALVDPHEVVPSLLALLLWSGTRVRVLVVSLFVVAAAASIAVGGVALNAYYLREAIPAQAYSELTVVIQYGLSALLWAIGVPDRPALLIGSLQYALVAVVAIVAGGLLARRIGSPALILFPAACAVIGGPYIHITQIASALPFALYLAATVPQRAAWAWVAAAVVALPWPALRGGRFELPLDAAIVLASVDRIAPRVRLVNRVAIAAAAFVVYVAFGIALRHVPVRPLRALEPPASVAASGFDPQLAAIEAARRARADVAHNGSSIASLVVRLPTWFGLLATFALGLAATKRPEQGGGDVSART